MIRSRKKVILSLVIVVLLMGLAACTGLEDQVKDLEEVNLELDQAKESEIGVIEEDGYYTSAEDLALYIYTYGKLPDNYITKEDANDLGWDPQKGNLWEVTDKMSIGGNKFGNREKLLPEADSRQYYEADVNYQGGYRGPERLVYSNDGLIFYTEDHYESFEQLY